MGRGLCRRVGRSLNTGVELDPRVSQRHLRAHSNAAADQGVHFCRLQESGQRSVSAAVGIHYLFVYDLTLFHIIQLELFGMSEMLKDLSVFKSNCDSH